LPKLVVGTERLRRLDDAIATEWLVANNLGGYASSTILGVNSRKYHGLLVAALNPPANRHVLLSRLDEEIQVGKNTYRTSSIEFRNNTRTEGFAYLTQFILDPFPTYTYDIEQLRLRKTIFMPAKMNVTVSIYRVDNGFDCEAVLRIVPMVNFRHFHSTTEKTSLNWDFLQTSSVRETFLRPSNSQWTLGISSSEGEYVPSRGEWMEKIYYRTEDSRGESCLDDNYLPGFFELKLNPNETKSFGVFAVGGEKEREAQNILESICRKNLEVLLHEELERRDRLLAEFSETHDGFAFDDWLKWCVLAADSFIVDRESVGTKSVIAGYHWFEDWGRDCLVSLPGLTLITGRFEDARQILLTLSSFRDAGLIPNKLPDHAEEKPIYNSVDATLWYINATWQYLKYTGDFLFVRKKLWETLISGIERYIKGTQFGIRLDSDGLILHGPKLTWMDTDATPRDGKAVEIQALWYNALKIMQLLATKFDCREEAERYSELAEKTMRSFNEKFWRSEEGCLFDVVSVDGHGDASFRPNQVIAVSLDFGMLDKGREMMIVENVLKRLWSGYGLRTLPRDDPRYCGVYSGDRTRRDRAYHNGTVWPWLTGPFVTAYVKANSYSTESRNFVSNNLLVPLLKEEVHRGGLGTVSEILDGDSPQPRGCISQAWSVAEPLRAYIEDVLLKRPVYEKKIEESIGL